MATITGAVERRKHMDITRLKLKGLERIKTALDNWAYDDEGGFVCYCEAIFNMLKEAEEIENEK